MKVSIITPTYNSEEWIIQTYESIVNQTHHNWEWIITDDCSSDETLKVLEYLSNNDDRVKVFCNRKNSGAAVSRNNSIEHAQGDFLAFIDSDDLWLPNKLESQIHFMGDKIDFSFTAYELVDGSGKKLDKLVDSNQSGSFDYHDMLKKKATLGCSTVMLRRIAFNDISMPLLRTGQDYALWLKLLRTGSRAYVLNDVLTQYRILPNSISRNKIKKAKRQWQIYREIEKLSFKKSLECFSFYAYRAIFRK
ncbi:glycosyltransferase family 2 protein [Photobacterium alginatilyticum]|uniref:Glycosyltransferase family 2 protein n=1 Tax=Photobacterium alginatilyticum TaxID=1775171 RepID=A0ABW9YCU0_9GAMM|nr:glycosyltransferase family A protein [Photobacterium alginatilyticum]NBI51584.1 glycosyltransferase family 2 protein [Photobacterium alginatilyticum]